MLVEQAVLYFFTAVGTLVLACLSLALDKYLAGTVTWLPVGLTILGMLIVFTGAMLLGLECRVARSQFYEESIAAQCWVNFQKCLPDRFLPILLR